MLHSFMVEMTAAIPIIAVAGILLGYIVKKNALLFGCIEASAFFVCYTTYCSILSGRITFSHNVGNVWYTLGSTVAWFLLFIMMTRVGILKINKHQKDWAGYWIFLLGPLLERVENKENKNISLAAAVAKGYGVPGSPQRTLRKTKAYFSHKATKVTKKYKNKKYYLYKKK